MICAPLAAALLALDGYLGLAGWQWLFMVEGIPTVFMGLYTKANLAESPAKASFLTNAEKALLQQRHAESKVSCSGYVVLLSYRNTSQAVTRLCPVLPAYTACCLKSKVLPTVSVTPTAVC